MTLFLVGYMGSGKSVIGRRLAEILNYDYIDFDDYIESKERQTISSIFETKGELYFRKVESNYLKELTGLKHTIVSLGGGTPCYGINMKIVLETNSSKTIYLKATIPTLVSRLYDERAKRPLITHIKTNDELSEFIGKHLFERAPYYEQSQISIKTDGQSVSDIAEAIILQLF